MGCLVVLVSLFTPRLVLLVLWLLGLVDRAFETVLIPVIGFVFAPVATTVYVMAWRPASGGLSGWGWALVFLGLLIDLGIMGVGRSGYSARRSRGRGYP